MKQYHSILASIASRSIPRIPDTPDSVTYLQLKRIMSNHSSHHMLQRMAHFVKEYLNLMPIEQTEG